MSYGDVIRSNCQKYSPSWWPKYAYHFTDVTNAIGILTSGRLYSRVRAGAKGLMRNDNASRQVINMTESQTTSFVRFYFRPLTPTQYHNEGFKHSAIRYHGDVNANVPVPIFFLFDLEKLLSLPGTLFSELGQAGHGSPLRSGVKEFEKLPFGKIFSNGAVPQEIMPYRHAEILYPEEFPIEGILKHILCRNESDKATLLNMLKNQESEIAYRKYAELVRVSKDANVFQRNGLFVESVIFHDDTLSYVFGDTPEKNNYANRYGDHGTELTPLKANFLFEWKKAAKTVLLSTVREVAIPYLRTKPVVFQKFPNISGAKALRVTLTIDEKIINVFEQPLVDFEVV